MWLKVSIVICRYATRFFLEIPPCAHHVIFITEFVLLIKIPPFYEVNSINRKWQAHVGISKIIILDRFYRVYVKLVKVYFSVTFIRLFSQPFVTIDYF